MGADGMPAGLGDREAPWRVDGVGPRWSPLRLLALLFFVGMLLCALGIAVSAVGDRDGSGVVLGVAGAVLFAHLLGFLAVVWLPRRRSARHVTSARTPDGTVGVRFGYSRWAYYWMTALLVLCLAIGAAVVLAAAAQGGTAGRVGAVGLAVLLGLTGWFLVTVLRVGAGAVTVSPAGIAHRGLVHLHVVPWYAVHGVGAGVRAGTPVIVVDAAPSPDTVVRRYTGWFGTADARELPRLVVRTLWLATDPATVLAALAFYHAHPELRGELATPEAPRRIAEGRARG
ncbi:hypothetical protein [Micromonospora sp. DT47]|uniref:hypothetical protein n=1 Tax=Micromonospora sp. DT47 TaxID=3393431 RepID=UPI003CF4BE56